MLLNVIGEKHEFRIICTSPDYKEVNILWGLYRWEEGEKKEFVIRGTESYIQSITSSLMDEKFDVKYIVS